ncbi:ATP-dependent DNA helicase [Solemya velum gill symbiont]|uniref:ATP-dependent DNA helicase n=2 Tax=Solemya velum gill symbiont TaxID=2340 RepID=UPI00099875AD|nr:ATP-dependent DNA helicase [Solemya velum gill symbiont]OOY52416.1 helicase [Solemya velum gill symbiont]OOY54929.1 helicase [Solemya velum gill symbiont]OOY55692.1 helicase [Solemya velum gill symbiont]OOY60604.1 helicase [Solemya velum gill symbiont]OOY62511.1 helicase [Solemya velum gill symbiont]
MSPIDDILGEGGELEQRIAGFRVRSQQLEMAHAVDDALKSAGTLVCEAGTGTGKTFAYLVPALLSGLKVIISTGTKNLQDQLFNRDLPRIRDSLGQSVSAALLKGRANYLCLHRMDSAEFDRRAASPKTMELLAQVREWGRKTRRGDIAELTMIPENAPIWPLVTSTIDNCLGQACPDYSKCFLVEARRNAQEADVVIINHHLLCADFSLKDEGFGELLPMADAFIIDEAHQLPAVANNFFGTSVSARQLQELCRDILTIYSQMKMKQSEVQEVANALDKSVRDFRLLLGLDERRGAWEELAADSHHLKALEQLHEKLADVIEVLEALKGTDESLDACCERAGQLSRHLDLITSDEDADSNVRWFETTRLGFRLAQTPLEIAEAFQKQMQSHANAWIFTSATLAVGGDFSHFCSQLGIKESETACWDSPFDYRKQALWYVPEGLPEPSHESFVEKLVESVIPLLEASKGRAFLLFTSYRALYRASEMLEEKIDYPLLVQGSAPKGELLDRFRELGNAVLLATSSFWEGVDVQGEALSLVVIDKLPFASPGDPVMQARLDAIKKRGLNPFMQYQLPQAVISLKQGAGRLIRGVEDRGVLVTGDMRMLNRPYGKIFIDAMPSFSRTRQQQDVEQFFSGESA